MAKMTIIMRNKILKAAEIVKNYNGSNKYILKLKLNLQKTNDVFEVINQKNQKYIHKFHNTKAKNVGKFVKMHPFFKVYYGEKMFMNLNDEIYIDQLLSRYNNTLHLWCELKPNDGFIKLEIEKNFILDNINEDVEVLDEEFNISEIIELKPHQKTAVRKLVNNPKYILGDLMGLGKVIANDQPVLTPNGWVKHGDLTVGDYVIGSNGKKTKVLATHPNPIKDYYKITFTDGSTVEACGEHLFAVHSTNQKKFKLKTHILSINQMLDKNGVLRFKGSGHNKNKEYKTKTYYKLKNGDCKWYIPMVKPVEFNKRDILIDPYLLGVLLGDGNMSQKTVNITTQDIEIINEINNNLPKTLKIIDKPSKYEYGIRTKTLKNNTLIDNLREYNLMGLTSDLKFIPDDYIYNTYDIRLEVLRGLLDTDGYCSTNDGTIQYYTTSEKLKDNVKEIIQSFGGVARESSKFGKYKTTDGIIKECKLCFILTINLPEGIIPFKLNRKVKLMKKNRKYLPSRGIKKIEFSRKTIGQCITVDAKDSLYIIKDYVVTHNTISTISSAIIGNFNNILIICPASLKYNWKHEINYFESNDKISVINGTTWVKNKWNIINPEILKNFHRLPVDENGKKINVDDLEPTPFELAEFDLIIIDEAHYFKNPKSQRSKLFMDFSKYTPYIWLLTGTPIPNKISDLFNLLKIIESPIANNYDFFLKRYCNAKFINTNRGKALKEFGASNQKELNNLLSNHMLRRTTKSSGVVLPDKFVRPIYLELTKQYKYSEYLDEYNEWYKEECEKGNKPTLNQHLNRLVELRKFLSLSKVGATIEIVENLISQDKKVIVFSCFTESIQKIHEHFGKKSVLIDGSVDTKKRKPIVDKFQKNKNIKVFCGNIIAAGVGLTLTAAEVIVFNDIDWSPANHAQAEKRAHRIGQDVDVNVLYMLLSDSIDVNMYNSLQRKTKNIDEITGDDNESLSMSMETIKTMLNVNFL